MYLLLKGVSSEYSWSPYIKAKPRTNIESGKILTKQRISKKAGGLGQIAGL